MDNEVDDVDVDDDVDDVDDLDDYVVDFGRQCLININIKIFTPITPHGN